MEMYFPVASLCTLYAAYCAARLAYGKIFSRLQGKNVSVKPEYTRRLLSLGGAAISAILLLGIVGSSFYDEDGIGSLLLVGCMVCVPVAVAVSFFRHAAVLFSAGKGKISRWKQNVGETADGTSVPQKRTRIKSAAYCCFAAVFLMMFTVYLRETDFGFGLHEPSDWNAQRILNDLKGIATEGKTRYSEGHIVEGDAVAWLAEHFARDADFAKSYALRSVDGEYWLGRDVSNTNFLSRCFFPPQIVVKDKVRRSLESRVRGWYQGPPVCGSPNLKQDPQREEAYRRSHLAIWVRLAP
jgi:hypothetical protein